MAQESDEALAIRVRTHIDKETNLYVCTDGEVCFVKFAYENRPENEALRNIITQVCDAVTKGLQRLNQIKEQRGING